MHLVLITLPLQEDELGSSSERDAIYELEDALRDLVETSGVGEADGYEFGDDKCLIFLYGPDADALFAVIEPVLVRTPIAAQAQAIKRYGDADDPAAREIRVTWPSQFPQ